MKNPSYCIRFSIASLVLGLAGQAAADTAIVVGVDHYPNLEPRWQLEGCVTDANDMAAMLKLYGFSNPIVLTNEKATKAGIMKALADAKSQSADERFVFFFAGHGDRTPDLLSGVILPSDTTPDPNSPEIGKDELANAVAAIPASSRTVILDSCFSGAMSRSLRGTLHSRFYSRKGAKKRDPSGSKDLELANSQDSDPIIPSSICYFTAAKDSQEAGEDDFDGVRHGIFTYYLTHKLDGSKLPWGQVQTDVSGQVQTKSVGLQSPVLSPAYVDREPFSAANSLPPAPPKPNYSVWDQYNEERPDPSKVQLLLTPDRATMIVHKDLIYFTVKTGVSGYLVILEKGTSGKINLLFPRSGKIIEASVHKGELLQTPASPPYWKPKATGIETIKAVLFSTPDAAKTLLDAFKDHPSVTVGRARDLELDIPTARTFYTSDVSFEVADGADQTTCGARAQPFSSGSTIRRAQDARVVVKLEPLREVGPMPGSLANRRPSLALQLTTGFQTFLQRGAHERYSVSVDTSSSTKANYVLRGELSCVGTIPSKPGPFLCVWRLFRDDSDVTLVAQWAGSARTYRDLTSNMGRDPALSREGLIGSLGNQIASELDALASGDSPDEFDQFVKTARTLSNVHAGFNSSTGKHITSLRSSEPFDMTLDGAPDGSDAYVVASTPEDGPRVLYVPIIKSVDGSSPMTLRDLVAGGVGPGVVNVIVLFRKADDSRFRSGAIDIAAKMNWTPAYPVSVLDRTLGSRSVDPVVSKIVELGRLDPAGSWSVAKFQVTVE